MNNQPNTKHAHYGIHHIPLLLRKILKEAFPGIKFKAHVRKRTMTLSWTDGPNESSVQQLLAKFQKKVAHTGKACVLISYKTERYSLEIDTIVTSKDYSNQLMFEAQNKFYGLPSAEKSKIMAKAPSFSEIIKNMFLCDYFFSLEPLPSKTLQACKFPE